MADIKLDFVWHTNIDGDLQVSVTPQGFPDQSLSTFTFDRKTILEGFQDEVNELWSSGEDEHGDVFEEWKALAENLKNTAYQIQLMITKEISEAG